MSIVLEPPPIVEDVSVQSLNPISSAAVVVGLNYRGTDMELGGCINDAVNVQSMLMEKGYDVHIITDEDESVGKREICMALLSLIYHPTASRLYFHYSGHGSQVRDTNGDERDGMDECLVLDNGIILDDELAGLMSCVDSDKRLMCVLDCCHSGSGMDLRYSMCKVYGRANKSHGVPPRRNRFRRAEGRRSSPATRGEVVMFSGCQDDQTSADMTVRGQVQGALTASLLKAMRLDVEPTFIELFSSCKRELKLLGVGQYPILSSGRKDMDVYRKFDY